MEGKVKTFWQRPEGKTGMGFLVLIAGGVAFGLYSLLPTLIVLMTNTLHAAFLLGALGVTTFVALDKRVHALVGFGYKSLMRGITKTFVTIDPIAIAEIHIRDMIENRENVKVQLRNLHGKMQELNDVIAANTEEKESHLKIAQKARSSGANDITTLKARQAGRLDKSNETLRALYTKMELVARVLKKIYENTDFIIQDVQDEVSVKKKEQAALKASSSAFRSAMKILNGGDPDKKYMFDLAMETICEDIAMKKGEMNEFLEITDTVMRSIDLQNDVFKDEGLKQLDAWINNGSSALLGTDKTVLIEKAHNPNEVFDLSQPLKLEDRRDNKYSKLF